MVIQWKIRKLRFGNNCQWRSWEYEAIETNQSQRALRVTKRHDDISNLAKELARQEGAEDFEFFPSGDNQRVSLSKGVLTQVGLISDGELGKLGALVQKYIQISRKS